MAGTSLLALLDDIASMLDDISAMTKVTAGKTAGVLGDDLALNANQLTGVRAERELPVVWAVAKGSFVNKCILLPLAFLISAFIPWLIQPLLMLGGAYLCFECAEKIWHLIAHRWHLRHSQGEKAEDPEKHSAKPMVTLKSMVTMTSEELLVYEKEKIKGAIRTDFILSAEIIVIALGTVQSMSLTGAMIVVSLIALLMTIGVYSLVAGIVKLDDLGLYLIQKNQADDSLSDRLGRSILRLCPWLMKTLSVVGTLAMFLVGGGILLHGFHPVAHFFEHWFETHDVAVWLSKAGMMMVSLILGWLLGSVVVMLMKLFQRPAKS
ncbi:DUF808 domain-containing protein [Aestuariicella sp. G3-2]|uniref:DUF808 domain-containing protein n=1 Tax=Pseudomaricurvus albidus TaxID=2842452 RepID=UPI001C0DF63D|nr:DUF808 domain-containing protein [Aestuariicella albida]MBU3071466.1 DUF808 domain-containing protein [Aestuariicella albida]